MAIAISPHQTREFVLQAERSLPAEQQTTFVLRTIPFAVRSALGVLFGIGARHGDDPMAGVPQAELSRLYVTALRACLVGWRNFRDAAGVEAKFESQTIEVAGITIRGAASDASLELLPLHVVAELANECLAGAFVSRDQVLS